MSNEENKDEVYEEKPQKVEITVKKSEGDKDQELENVKAERDDYQAKLELLAQRAFEERRKSAGAPEEVDTPEKLQGFILSKKNLFPPSGTIPLSPEQYGEFSEDLINSEKSVHELSFNSVGEMLHVLDERAKKGDKEASLVLGKIAQKSMKSSQEVEFTGELLKNLQRLDKEGKEARQKEIKEKWSRKK